MYSSDLKRAKQTAEIVGQYINLTPILSPESGATLIWHVFMDTESEIS